MTSSPRQHRLTLPAIAAWLVLTTHAFAAILVDFDQAEYVLPNASTPLTVGVIIDADDATLGIQSLANGLFSAGLKVEFLDVKAEAMSPSDVAPAPELDNFGPLASADIAVAPGEAAFRGNVVLSSPGDPATPHTGSSLATITLQNLASAAGSYGLSLDFYKPLGPTEDSFVDGLGATLDSQIVFGSAIVTVGLPGDYNLDGEVGTADYTVWRDSLGSTADLAADGDGDGEIGTGDYQVWRDNFGATTAGPATVTPEPAALATVAAAALAAWFGRRGRR